MEKVKEDILEYKKVKEQIKEKLSRAEDFHDNQNLFELGLDSLQIMRLANVWRRAGAKVSFAKLIEEPTLASWCILLNNLKSEQEAKATEYFIQPPDEGVPFPLTDVQYSYWVGRSEGQPLGGVGCHAYLEFDGHGVDSDRLGQAWEKLISHHPMLRSRFLENGEQVIEKTSKAYPVLVHDFRSMRVSDIEPELEKLRNKLSHRCLDVKNGQVIGLELSLLPENKTRLFFDVDLLVADVQSLQILLRDLSTAYNSRELPDSSKNWNFKKYLESQKEENKKSIEAAEIYWTERIPKLPSAPELPLCRKPEQIKKPWFKRRTLWLDKEEWSLIQNNAAAYQVTPAMALLTAYAKVLERWSANSHFLINIPLFNRKTEVMGIEDVVADFTDLLLLEINMEDEKPFITSLREIQSQFHRDVAHGAYSGVQVQRELTKYHGERHNFAPIVFACNLGTPLINKEFEESLGAFGYMVSQTPQVYIDFQTYEWENGLMLIWDSVDELFPEHLLEDMFEGFESLIKSLIHRASWKETGELLTSCQLKRREEAFNIPILENTQCLHTGFFIQALNNPNNIALIDSGSNKELTYGELAEKALSVAAYLTEHGIKDGETVAVTLPRGINQVIAIIGILAAGNCYVPVSLGQPHSRRVLIHNKLDITYVITDTENKHLLQWSEDSDLMQMEELLSYKPLNNCIETSPEQSAYIILTSGTTGEPKGVEISHASAWNTISDINNKYEVGCKDRVLAVSALDFDLSVFDVFGLLGAGGAVVLLPEEERKNPSYWLKQLERYKVTMWNSVPILFDMLLISAKSEAIGLLPLRLVLLSGDWIGLELPERMEQYTKNCRMVAMGGATEASIWSNYFDVTLPIPQTWVSIPYGKALLHQSYRIIDKKGRDCPDWVEGELWIGGGGVAKGYRGDYQLTQERFVTDGGIRWYKTGDMGRFWPDGTIEFLGRRDFQVKIRGHRIELEEIETAIKQHPAVHSAVVVAVGETQGTKYLKGYLVLDREKRSLLFEKIGSSTPGNTLWKSIQQIPVAVGRGTEKVNINALYSDIDNLAAQTMLNILTHLGAWRREGESHSFNSFFDKFNIELRYKTFLESWLDALVTAKLIRIENRQYFSNVNKENFMKPMDNSDWYSEIVTVTQYLNDLEHYGAKMLTGKISPLEVFYSKHIPLSLTGLTEILPGNIANSETLERVIKEVLKTGEKDKPVKVLEFGTRNISATKTILNYLNGEAVNYTYSDTSKFFLEEAENSLSDYKAIQYTVADFNKDISEQGLSEHSFDCIIATNSLHRTKNLDATLMRISKMLAPNGIAIISEMTINSSLHQVTAGFLEDGFTHFEDERKQERVPFISTEQWLEKLNKGHFKNVALFPEAQKEQTHGLLLVAQVSNEAERFAPWKLEEYLQDKLPEYMIPKAYELLTEMPSTMNGKIDRKALAVQEKSRQPKKNMTKPTTEIQRKVSDFWSQIFSIEEIDLYDNYFELGGDSLIATKLTAMLREEFKIDISLGTVFNKPTVFKLAEAIESSLKEAKDLKPVESLLPDIIPNPEDTYLPFPLTDVQYAYWIGRSGIYELGGVATHCYFELEGQNLELDRLNQSLNKLIKYHAMMRVVILSDGRQQILEDVPQYTIEVMDITKETGKVASMYMEKLREHMSHQVLSTENWPLFEIKATCFEENKVRLHISFDNLIFDGWSMFHLLSEWAKLYKDSDKLLPDLQLTFRDYVLGLENIKSTELYENSKKYWQERIETLPCAPELPLAKSAGEIAEQRFHRRSYKLAKSAWDSLKNKAREYGITPSVLLISAYAETLRRWSKNSTFSINLTQFSRIPMHKEVYQVVGDFTTLTLLEINSEGCNNFLERTQKLQKQLLSDLDNSYFNGIEVQRELAKNNGGTRVGMPVVFTSGLGIDQWNEGEWLGKLVYNISQTPQVWLDHQVVEQDGALCLFWDSVDELFYEGMLDEMFEAYSSLVEKLATEEQIWMTAAKSCIDIKISDKRSKANQTDYDISNETLDSLLLKSAEKFPEKTAVISEVKSLNYSELVIYSSAAAGWLKEQKAKGTKVAIVMEKGWEQIVAVYAALFAEAVYVPIDADNPIERIKQLLNNAETNIILSQSRILEKHPSLLGNKCMAIDTMEETNNVEVIRKSSNRPDSTAYVIYTSGSTGTPKGVVIDHGGAVNTILDINRRFAIDSTDTVLALSNLNFDLSVYDIFGVLAAGGTVVLPNPKEAKEPSHWLELINREKVTVWNTVPMFMQMLVEFIENRRLVAEQSLRVVLLSGDWIPLELPNKIKKCFANGKVICLGGATEASIWSNYFEVKELEADWKSIPYGWPLSNQKYYVLNDAMEDCPTWAVGKLYIGGMGVAKEYLNDMAKTEEKFPKHPVTGERLYCTDDLGRYKSDGSIEFLGREDFQVKISGYRIELGEIEAAAKEYTGIKEAIATTVVNSDKSLRLVLFVTLNSEGNTSYKEEELISLLRDKIPGYMIPALIIETPSIPLTSNGKVDGAKLKALAAEKMDNKNPTSKLIMPQTDFQKNIWELWRNILDCETLGIDESFFELGGNSLQVIQLTNDLNGKYKKDVSIETIFQNPTVRTLAEAIQKSLD